MAKRPRIAVVGSANVDLTTFSDHFPKPGETIFGDKFDLGFGGKGANQAAAARLCGADVFMVARVGDDLFGPATIKNFEKLGIDAAHVRQVGGVSSGVAPIFVESSGQNRIIVVKGANDTLKPADVDEAADMLKSAGCIVLQFEIPLETVYYTIQFAHKNGIRCILNPAPAQPIDLKAVADLDYFVPNETEAERIAGLPVRNVEDAKRCAENLLASGIRRVLITLGANRRQQQLLQRRRRFRRERLASGRKRWHALRARVSHEVHRQYRRRRRVHWQLRHISGGRNTGDCGNQARKSLRRTFNHGRGNAKVLL
jgi:ribokinase